MNNAYLYK